jgi:hypothetical protein
MLTKKLGGTAAGSTRAHALTCSAVRLPANRSRATRNTPSAYCVGPLSATVTKKGGGVRLMVNQRAGTLRATMMPRHPLQEVCVRFRKVRPPKLLAASPLSAVSQSGLPSASSNRISPSPNSLIPGSIFARSPTTTHIKLSGCTMVLADAAISAGLSARILLAIVS